MQKTSMLDVGKNSEHKQMRRIAFLAIVASTVAVIVAVITLPTLYNFVQSLESHLMLEADFCKSRSSDMWREITALQIGRKHFDRIKREWLFGHWVSETSGSYDATPVPQGSNYGPTLNADFNPEQCCTCYQSAAGPPGPEGPEGKHGEDGVPGKNGKNGIDAEYRPRLVDDKDNETCIICPPGLSGPPGNLGPKGPPGHKGADGVHGVDGQKGDDGLLGQPGPKGKLGQQGKPGAHGVQGRLVHIPGPQGPDGTMGKMGDLGPSGLPGIDGLSYPGQPGDIGENGLNGLEGNKGPRGPPGSKGNDGLHSGCNHCPDPRVPPGYY